MALKVLLADDSAAIKKVVQLSLQDYGAEVKSVGSGKDVLDVCRSFRPDIAFVDVLLPHKTGYEVVSEIKKDSALKQTPVVMLWSGFMAFDEGKFKASGADEKLEKPFEVAGLRSLITKLVPKMQANPVAKHLEFAKADFAQEVPIGAVPPVRPAPAPRAAADIQTPPPLPSAPKEEWSMASFDDIGKFSAEGPAGAGSPPKGSPPNTAVPKPGPASSEGPDESQWVRKDLASKFKVPVPSDSEDENTVSFQYSETDIHDTSFLFKAPQGGKASGHGAPNTDPLVSDAGTGTGAGTGTATEILAPIPPKHDTGTKPPKATVAPPPPLVLDTEIPEVPAAPMTQIDKAAVEKQTREIIERVVWKIVPEIASQVIREEIQRLLGEDK